MEGRREDAASAPAPLTVSRPELLVDGTDEHFRRLVHGLFSFLSVHTAIRNGYAELIDLPGPQYTIILCIRHLGATGPVSVGAVAGHLRLSGSFVTVETNKLERLGLITKRRSAADRRTVALELTARGRELLDSIAPLRRQVNDVEFGCLSAEEFRLLVPLVERLIESGESALSLLAYIQARGDARRRATADEAGSADLRP